MEKVYMLSDYFDEKAKSINGAQNIGVQHMGKCGGRIVKEDGTIIGSHHSSSFGWLRADLKSKLDDQSKYEIIDLIGEPIPDRFQSKGQ